MLHSCGKKISHVTVPELRLARGNSSATLSPRASLKVHRRARVGTGRVSAGCGARATLALCGWGSIVIIMQSAIVCALGKHNYYDGQDCRYTTDYLPASNMYVNG